jgi:hypothetical protein
MFCGRQLPYSTKKYLKRKENKRRMKILGSKKTATAIALFLLLTIAVTLVALPAVNAHTPPWQITTFAFVQAVPNPVGVGQSVLVYMFLDKIPDGAMLANDKRFHNYTLTITAPNGTHTTKVFPIVWDPTSNQAYSFTPDQVGTYILDFTFPGQTYQWTGGYANDLYTASSASTTLTVQQAQIVGYPTTPLPTQYWTRPIYGQNPNWFTVSSNWLGTGAPGYAGLGFGGNAEGAWPGDAVGPQTGHIMWTKPLQSGGVVGGNNFVIQGDTFFEGSAYQQRFVNPIIIDGRIYYKEPLSFSGPSSGPTDCVDLRTGKLIWSRTDVPSLSFGYMYDVQDGNQHGVYPPLLFATSGGFGTASGWRAFDADTGNPLFNVTSIPSGSEVLGVNGEYLIYSFANKGTSTPSYYLSQWNSSNLWYGQYSGASTSPSIVPPITNAGDARMFDWNVSAPDINTVRSFTTVGAIFNDVILCYNGTLPSGGGGFGGAPTHNPYTYFAVNLNASKGAIGKMLWSQTVNPPATPLNVSIGEGGLDPVNRVFVEVYRETAQFVGYSLDTGKKLWGPTAGQPALDYYGSPGSGTLADCFAYGKLYSSAYAGILYCYDTKNGSLLWTYGNGGAGNSTNSGFEVPGNYPTFVNAIGSGIVYLVTTEHTVETPIYKGALVRAVNATDGTEIWTLSDYTGEFTTDSFAIADGYATFFNGYDNQIYSVGRGPSATTVQAPMTAITVGDTAVIQGTVMDVSAGTKQDEQAANFPNGVPCVSDASMKDWMGYVYQQMAHPASATGVTVTIDAVDPNNNFVHLGVATSDITGTYGLAWTAPNVPGKYTVIATFAGTNGYWPSYAETNMYVQSAPPATPPPKYPEPIDYTWTIILAAIVIIIAIAIVGILLYRKK